MVSEIAVPKSVIGRILRVRIVGKIIAAMKAAFVLLVVALITIQAAAQTPRSRQAPTASTEIYESVDTDADGNLRILTSDRRTIIVPKGGSPKAGESFGKQTAFENPVLSDDRRAVGAQAMFGNCCTSYDIPLQLVIYSSGKTHRFEGGLAIFDWHFADGGRRVVFSQQTVHFTCSVHWELRDIASERLLDTADIPEVCGQIPLTEGEGAEMGDGNRLGVQMTAHQVVRRKGVFGMSSSICRFCR